MNLSQKLKAKLVVTALHYWARDLRDSKPKTNTITSSYVFKLIQKFSPGIRTNIHWRDTDFEVVDFNWWEKVLEYPFWTAKDIKYISEVSDCEAFSLFFLSVNELFLKTNGVFSVGGTCYWDTSKGQKTSSHRYNFIMANENNKLGLWIYEPMYNKWTKLKEGTDKIIIEKVFGLNGITYQSTMINN